VDLIFYFQEHDCFVLFVLGCTGKQLVIQICLLYVISGFCYGLTEIFTILAV